MNRTATYWLIMAGTVLLLLAAAACSSGISIPENLITPTTQDSNSGGDTQTDTGTTTGTNTTSAFGIPTGLTGTVDTGGQVWSSSCAACHNSMSPKTFGQLESSMNISAMRTLNLSQQQLADLTAYLNRDSIQSTDTGTTGGSTGGSTPPTTGSGGDDDDDDEYDDDDVDDDHDGDDDDDDEDDDDEDDD